MNRSIASAAVMTAVMTALAGALLAAAPASAQDSPIRLKVSLWVPPAHPLVQSAKDWAASLEKASGGTITSTIFPAEQLGRAFDHYDLVRDGIASVGYVSPGYQPGRFPIFNGSQLPFTVSNARGGSKAVTSWYQKYAAKEMADTKLCFAFVHDPGTLHSKKKIVSPAEIRGMKIRPANATVGEIVTTLGGTNVQASAPESREALERGIADAITFPWNSIFLFGIDKVTKYHIDVPLYTSTFTWTMNRDLYEKASAAQKKAIDDHCNPDWAVKFSDNWTKFEEAGREKMRAAPGHEIVPLTAEQLVAWREATSPVAKNWAESVRKTGMDPAMVMAELKDLLKKNDAAY